MYFMYFFIVYFLQKAFSQYCEIKIAVIINYYLVDFPLYSKIIQLYIEFREVQYVITSNFPT